MKGDTPFAYHVVDQAIPRSVLLALQEQWPAPEWGGWVRYDPTIEKKKASDLQTPLPDRAGIALALLARLRLGDLLGMADTVADLSLCGGGLHEIPPGGHLGCHLDASHHPRLGLERAWSAVLWVHTEWQSGWGGELVLHDRERNPVVRIEPKPARLAVFATGSRSWHSVARVTGPAPRRSLALFGYRACTAPGSPPRPRSLFVAAPGEDTTPEADRARLARAR